MLKRAPEDIVLGELVRDTERDLALARCFADPADLCAAHKSS
ncbi:hypothetical protein KG088_18985 [Halomonas sp. TRM85114]|nr:hypothetical protein [Halomonas jincaotanensis]